MKKIIYQGIIAATFIVIVLLGSISVVLSPNVAKADESETDPLKVQNNQATITITGQAKGSTDPDLGVVYFRVETKAWKAADAKDNNARIVDQIIIALQALKIDEDDIETMNFNIQPKYRWENSRQIFEGYQVIHSLRVKTNDFDKMGKIVDTVVDKGGLIDRINFELSAEKQSEAKMTMLQQATLDAKLKAEAIVGVLDVELGNIVSISASGSDYQPYTYYKAYSDEYSLASDISTNIQPKNVDLTGSVTIVFEILQ